MRVYVGTVAWRGLHPVTEACVMRLLHTRSEHRLTYDPFYGDALVERARAQQATAFLNTDCDVYVSIDSDIMFRPSDVFDVAEQAVTHNIVAGVYTTRSSERCFPSSHFLLDQPVEFGDDPTPVEIMWAATGFLAVHRRVFEQLKKRKDMPLCCKDMALPFYPFYTPFVVKREGLTIFLSEDFALSERARECGFKVYCNPVVSRHLGHMGEKCYDLDDIAAAQAPKGVPLTITRTDDRRYTIERAEVESEIAIAI